MYVAPSVSRVESESGMRYPSCPPNMIESVLVPVVTLLKDSARSASQS